MSPSARSARFPRMVRGSVVVQRRRCGKPSCRCADGAQLHESTVLSYSAGGRNRTLMLAEDQIEAVRAAVERYRVAQMALETEANAGLESLISARAAARRAR